MTGELFFYRSQHWQLLPERAIYWQEEKALIVSDLHLGKATHFRKSGIAVPAGIAAEDLFRLQRLITRYQPEQIIITGDMFHSHENKEVDYFEVWRRQFPHIRFHLVVGNHDIMPEEIYSRLNIHISPELTIRNIHFIHEPCGHDNGYTYTFSGHLHPGYVMAGIAKQRLRLPCFYFSKHCCILPAFGEFTGLASMNAEPDEPVFVIAGDSVVRAQ
ncbi:MAG: ligase-associated DNA damage response endonuclease PdeM [Chitinophaga sp.]|uniref:ligase-associated DNA damage response endonuclease PdeM n=1 Tax=Chitinophaga sp. TaxID=1869181 RepID=UPI0025BB7D3E|nr:ligase-associated DNA damage response endonuclease PdeM [Chitinophaga sp.]MBV8255654.1 ligase-associated DNA damage response endonuclease PdeM [Chitinophaga sp.]